MREGDGVRCEKCRGFVVAEDDRKRCINCGHSIWSDPEVLMPLPVQHGTGSTWTPRKPSRMTAADEAVQRHWSSISGMRRDGTHIANITHLLRMRCKDLAARLNDVRVLRAIERQIR